MHPHTNQDASYTSSMFSFHLHNPETLNPTSLKPNHPLTQWKHPFLHFGASLKAIKLILTEEPSLEEMLRDEDLIGVIGQRKKMQINYQRIDESILISESDLLGSLTALRPYAFCNILVEREMDTFPIHQLLRCSQTLTFKFDSVERICLILTQLSAAIAHQSSNFKVKKIIERAIIHITKINHLYYLTLNKKQHLPPSTPKRKQTLSGEQESLNQTIWEDEELSEMEGPSMKRTRSKSMDTGSQKLEEHLKEENVKILQQIDKLY